MKLKKKQRSQRTEKTRSGRPKGMPKSSKKGLNRKQLEVALLDVMRDNPTVAFNYKQISSAIGAKSLSERQLVISILDALAANETVDEVERGKYKLNTRAGYVEGV
ncbi:MAG: hypothetical protein J6W49_06130, partial [Paludibacteraceae bacterium]|nr:hypothetical protein [Paludibacteraceae bacterium]